MTSNNELFIVHETYPLALGHDQPNVALLHFTSLEAAKQHAHLRAQAVFAEDYNYDDEGAIVIAELKGTNPGYSIESDGTCHYRIQVKKSVLG